MDLIHAVDEGDAQPGLVRGDPLELPDERPPHPGGLGFAQRDVEQRPHAVVDQGFAQQGGVEREAARAVGDDEGLDGQLGHLPDLLFEGHPREQLLRAETGVGRRQYAGRQLQ